MFLRTVVSCINIKTAFMNKALKVALFSFAGAALITLSSTIIKADAATSYNAPKIPSLDIAMPVGARSAQPIGHFEFCQNLPEECRPQIQYRKPLRLKPAVWSLLNQINNHVNTTVIAMTDQEQWGKEEWWSFPIHYGDCEDYVLEKRRLLIEAGIPASYLLITVVRQTNGDGHAVLAVTTDHGDLILDNLEAQILSWAETDYEFLKRQAQDHAGHWVTINDGRSVVVGSVRKKR